MSEVYTLKQIQLDAARYRWIRENVTDVAWQFVPRPGWPNVTPVVMDQFIDYELTAYE